MTPDPHDNDCDDYNNYDIDDNGDGGDGSGCLTDAAVDHILVL